MVSHKNISIRYRRKSDLSDRLRQRHRWVFEQLEGRTLLAAVSRNDLAMALALSAPTDSTSGLLSQGNPVFFQLNPTGYGLLVAHVSAPGLVTRLSLLDSHGNLLDQSDGLSASDTDDVIVQQIVNETGLPIDSTDYLELQTLAGPGKYTLTTDLTSSSLPGEPVFTNSSEASLTLMVSGDFRGDGHADLATVGVDIPGQGEVEVVPGNGDGTFQSPLAPISLGTLVPNSLVTGDFTGNGRADLAVVGVDSASGEGEVEVLLSNNDGTFQIMRPINLGGLEPSFLATGEFAGDGRTGLAVAGVDSATGEGEVEVLLNNNDGTLQATSPINLGDLGPSSFVMGDFTGDGRADLAVLGVDSASGQSEVDVLLGNAEGTSEIILPINLGDFGPSSLVAGDFRGNGRSDVAVAGVDPATGQGEVEVLLGNGDGTFQIAPPINLGDLAPSSLVGGDFAGDGRVDLAVADAGSASLSIQSQVEILLNKGDGTFQTTTPINPGGSYLVTGDFNGDSRVDLAEVNGFDDANYVTIFINNNDGTFQTAKKFDLGEFALS